MSSHFIMFITILLISAANIIRDRSFQKRGPLKGRHVMIYFEKSRTPELVGPPITTIFVKQTRYVLLAVLYALSLAWLSLWVVKMVVVSQALVMCFIVLIGLCVHQLVKSANKAFSKITLHENAIVLNQLTGEREFHFSVIDSLHSFDIKKSYLNDDIVSYGYRISENGKSVCEFDSRDYTDLSQLEAIYNEQNPYVKEIVYR